MKGYYTVKTQSFKALDGKVKSFSLLIDGVEPKSLSPFSLTPTADGKPAHGNLVLVDDFGCKPDNFQNSLKEILF